MEILPVLLLFWLGGAIAVAIYVQRIGRSGAWFLVALLFSPLLLLAPAAALADGYGETRWGMSPAEVKGIYPGARQTSPDSLTVKGVRVAGHEAWLVFTFLEDRLARTAVVFTDADSEHPANLVTRYQQLQSLLTEKYGPPTSSETRGSSLMRMLQDADATTWGGMLAMGLVGFATTYETPSTRVISGLSSASYEITFGIVYDSKELLGAMDARDRAEKMKGL